MRPSGITDGILDAPGIVPGLGVAASMRPSGITDGILVATRDDRFGVAASMRPSGITDGITAPGTTTKPCSPSRFNEAVGYYRRNQDKSSDIYSQQTQASMRPSGITDGIAAADTTARR